jgi:hypothetical protein
MYTQDIVFFFIVFFSVGFCIENTQIVPVEKSILLITHDPIKFNNTVWTIYMDSDHDRIFFCIHDCLSKECEFSRLTTSGSDHRFD